MVSRLMSGNFLFAGEANMHNYVDVNDDMVKIFERSNSNKTGQD